MIKCRGIFFFYMTFSHHIFKYRLLLQVFNIYRTILKSNKNKQKNLQIIYIMLTEWFLRCIRVKKWLSVIKNKLNFAAYNTT